jgi:hypothetical protein
MNRLLLIALIALTGMSGAGLTAGFRTDVEPGALESQEHPLMERVAKPDGSPSGFRAETRSPG